MEIRQRIIQTLEKIAPALQTITPDFYIIGTSATILSGLDVGNTSDIDILTTSENCAILKSVWSHYREDDPATKDNGLFISDFASFTFPWIDVEVMGDLRVMKDGSWQPLIVQEYTPILINDLTLRIPTIREQLRILYFFGREKDLKRIEQINKLL